MANRLAGRTRCPHCGQRLAIFNDEDGDLVIVAHIQRACTLRPANWHTPVWAKPDFLK
jgi:hypothetical protein